MLRDFISQGHIDHLGVFTYSREEGTPAARMTGQVDPQVARDRADKLVLEQAGISSDKLAGNVGKELNVLFEDNDEEGPFGRHQGQAPEVDGVVRLDRETEGGGFVKVRITGSGVYDLEGEIILESECRIQDVEHRRRD
jgi:ribosomal protein S12 methylthiotransferase